VDLQANPLPFGSIDRPREGLDNIRDLLRLAQRDYAARILNLQSQIVSIVADGCTCSESAARSLV
jgi:hypothetical protein